jgi:hypothetical protein
MNRLRPSVVEIRRFRAGNPPERRRAELLPRRIALGDPVGEDRVHRVEQEIGVPVDFAS